MPSRAYHESLWEGMPEGLTPAEGPLRESFLLDALAAETRRLGRPARVLDVGCGEGHFAAALARAGAEVVAIDVAEEPLRRLRLRHPDIDARLAPAEAALPLRDSSFDLVWSGETIEHVADTGQWLSEIRRVLRSGGPVLLTTPDHGLLLRLRLALSPSAFAAHFDPSSDHLRFYTPRALEGLLADFGFEEVTVVGAGGLPAARRVLLASGRRKRF
ncbi:MAG TPA: class I SAM-dependent methyltransferase [Solirubrobacteraceae bacterium]|jgi:2-polyprenyl-3-methyl-5-hydroxy-6-metoxy-1,4-benzoquinol methylase|nr:class I SAM-dependent methyltransferase [Solirubrobacteraceae bacterium]